MEDSSDERMESTYRRSKRTWMKEAVNLVGETAAEDLVQEAAMITLVRERAGGLLNASSYVFGSMRRLASHAWRTEFMIRRVVPLMPKRSWLLPTAEVPATPASQLVDMVDGEHDRGRRGRLAAAIRMLEYGRTTKHLDTGWRPNPRGADLLRRLLAGATRRAVMTETGMTSTQFRLERSKAKARTTELLRLHPEEVSRCARCGRCELP